MARPNQMVRNLPQTVCGAGCALSIDAQRFSAFIVHSSCIHFHLYILLGVTSQMSMLRGRGCPEGVWVGSCVSEVLAAFVASLAGMEGNHDDRGNGVPGVLLG